MEKSEVRIVEDSGAERAGMEVRIVEDSGVERAEGSLLWKLAILGVLGCGDYQVYESGIVWSGKFVSLWAVKSAIP